MMYRFITGLAALFVAASAAAQADGVFAFVEKRCVACHNSKLKSGDIDLTGARAITRFDQDREIWERVVEKLETRQMPPPGVPHPTPEESHGVTSWLNAEFARQDRTAKPDAGRVTARRLNRTEYNNTMRDLFGLDLRPADRFPADGTAFGFDNVSDALMLSPALLEKYVDAAEFVTRTAIFGPPSRKPAAVHYSAPVRINLSRGKRTPVDDLHNYDETGLSTVHAFHVTHRFPVEAEYSFQLVLNGHRPNQSEPVRPALYIDGKLIKEFEVDATDLEGQIVEFRHRVTAGDHLLSATYLKNYHGLPPQYNGPEPSKRDPKALINPRGKLTEADIETLRKYGTKIKTDGIETRVDNRYEAIDIGGPFEQTKGASPESLRRVFTCGEKTSGCARKIVTDFAGRAFRRPVQAAEVDQYVQVFDIVRKQGEPFEEGIATALQAILVSPKFLYRMESDAPARAGRTSAPVNQYELASRLSYFLWSSMPDEPLLDAAKKGTLRNPAVLESQVRRMLRDPKAAALAEEFAGQWLQIKNVDVVRPDHEKFPLFEDSLRAAMKKETELFIGHIFQADRSVLEMVDAPYSFWNERLARFYGAAGITGPEFRQVDVSKTERGGGILAHASVLTVSSYSTRTSPVLRGKWVLENVLNSPPPAPPANVPPLDESKVGSTATLRQQMEEHRRNPACASCHARLDPMGFGLENFDAVGAWRTHDGKLPVDAAGEMPDGRTFRNPSELKKMLVADGDRFVRGLSEKLLIYALGRGLERYDRPVVAQVAAQAKGNNYSAQQLVLAVVKSLPFQERRTKEMQIAQEAQRR